MIMLDSDIPLTLEELKNIKDNITNENFRYLIGKLCQIKLNCRCSDDLVRDIYSQLGRDFGYASPSIVRRLKYARAIDRVQEILPDAATDLLEGKVRISMEDTIILAKMEFPEIRAVMMRLDCEKTPSAVIIKEQKALRKKAERRGRPKINLIEPMKNSIKNTPAYDPDAQISALTYTIPSWVSAVDKVSVKAEFYNTSQSARRKLEAELVKLRVAADKIIALIAEGE